jgi:hypothetical protein
LPDWAKRLRSSAARRGLAQRKLTYGDRVEQQGEDLPKRCAGIKGARVCSAEPPPGNAIDGEAANSADRGHALDAIEPLA